MLSPAEIAAIAGVALAVRPVRHAVLWLALVVTVLVVLLLVAVGTSGSCSWRLAPGGPGRGHLVCTRIR